MSGVVPDSMAYSLLMPLAPWESALILEQALGSLALQTLPAEELLISSDGALPEALLRVLEQSRLPVRLIEGPGAEGVGPVLARGLLACRHELVVRADADDLSLPERCALQIATLQQSPDLAALSSPILEFQRDPERPSGLRGVPQGSEAIRRFSFWRNPLNHPAVALRRSRVLAAGNYRAMPGFEDYDLWLRLLACGARLSNAPAPLVCARVGPAHLARRHGCGYARRELAFLLCCAREGLLPWPSIACLLLLRLPLRLLHPSLLATAMGWFRRPYRPERAATRDGEPPAAD
jgi:amylovoran biosynthesis glycosyltransferase AmsE